MKEKLDKLIDVANELNVIAGDEDGFYASKYDLPVLFGNVRGLLEELGIEPIKSNCVMYDDTRKVYKRRYDFSYRDYGFCFFEVEYRPEEI